MFRFTVMAGRPRGPVQLVPRVLTLNEIGHLNYRAADIFRMLPPDETVAHIEFAAHHGLLRNDNLCPTCGIFMNRVMDRDFSLDGYRWKCSICRKSLSLR